MQISISKISLHWPYVHHEVNWGILVNLLSLGGTRLGFSTLIIAIVPEVLQKKAPISLVMFQDSCTKWYSRYSPFRPVNIAPHYKTSQPSHAPILAFRRTESLRGASVQPCCWKDPEQRDRLDPITSLPEGNFPEIFLMQGQNSHSFIFFWLTSTAPLRNVNVPGFNDVTR